MKRQREPDVGPLTDTHQAAKSGIDAKKLAAEKVIETMETHEMSD